MEEKNLFDLHMEDTWENLAKLTGVSNSLFDRTLFLMGYDFSSNSYLIQGDYHALIDPGNDYTSVMQLLELGITPTSIKKVAITHGHPDHVMGVVEFFRGYRGFGPMDLEIFLHEAGPEEFITIVRDLGCRITLLRGGEILDFCGLPLEVIHTPGHTIDGLCFYHSDSRTVFTGDTVLPLAMAEVDDKAGGGRLDHYFYAIRTLLKRPVDHVLPGHGGVAVHNGRWVIEETWDGLIKKKVGFEINYVEAAIQLAREGLLEEALFYLGKALVKEPDNLQAREMQAFLLNDLGRAAEAVTAFDELLKRRADHQQALMGKGLALLGLGRHAESLACFDAVLASTPDLREAQIYKGMSLYLAGRQDEALDIPAFEAEFTSKLKEELARLAQSKAQ